MEQIKIIIVEDELLVAESLQLMLQSMGYEVVKVYETALGLLADFKPGLADLLIMDIHLKGEMTGAEAGRVLSKIADTPIIYLTNVKDGLQKELAIRHSNVIYYLSKPFNMADLETALNISEKRLSKPLSTGSSPEKARQAPLLPESIFIKEGQSHKPIKIADIVYLKAEGSYCEMFSVDKKYLYSENLSYFGERLAFSPIFVRIHRSYIINTDYIEKIRDNSVWVMGEPLPIGKSYRDTLLSKFRFLAV